MQKSRVYLSGKKGTMRRTPLAVKEAIGQKLKEKKTYKNIAQELLITERVARKWGQAIKKKQAIGTTFGTPQERCAGFFFTANKSSNKQLASGQRRVGSYFDKGGY